MRHALKKVVSMATPPYLAAEGNLNGDGNHLGQQASVEGHHEGHRVIVGEHQRHLVDAQIERCSLTLARVSNGNSKV